ncbi:hypothetical protein N7447_007850 [Penicillium robsamsonii]|uniref:uncharacterized protein n=1 Tax=Penicillium robsamsonii TaxID=1792511 RepID=UPI0025487AD2|nr:uncharacterized protein N7447_007850 [Penicillium robsamsonii]KAJ5817842.1 hypothetical protein N7447_007850 [Penicillium robsamsonii]
MAHAPRYRRSLHAFRFLEPDARLSTVPGLCLASLNLGKKYITDDIPAPEVVYHDSEATVGTRLRSEAWEGNNVRLRRVASLWSIHALSDPK